MIDDTVQNRHPDLILLSETWLTPFSPSVSIPGYEFYHLDQQHKKGGGVGILASSRLRCNLQSDLSSKLSESECLTIDVTLQSGEHCLVSSMYRPPNSEIPVFLASYSSLLCAMKKECPKGIIIGLDQNMNFLRAHSHRLTNDFIQLNLDFGMIPTITRPTRITNSSATLIDNIIVSQSFCGSYISSIIVNDMSDYLPTACILNSLAAVVKEPLEVKSRDTRPKNLKALKTQLSNQNWSYELDNESPSISMDRIHNTLTSIVDRCIPVRTRKIGPKHVQLHQRNKVLHNHPPLWSEKTLNQNQKLVPFRDHHTLPKRID